MDDSVIHSPAAHTSSVLAALVFGAKALPQVSWEMADVVPTLLPLNALLPQPSGYRRDAMDESLH